jgi:YHS domain-containing protein
MAYHANPNELLGATATRPQQTCPIDGNPLGHTGVPVTVTLKGEPVFVCSQGCAKKAQQDPDKYLKRVQLETAARD